VKRAGKESPERSGEKKGLQQGNHAPGVIWSYRKYSYKSWHLSGSRGINGRMKGIKGDLKVIYSEFLRIIIQKKPRGILKKTKWKTFTRGYGERENSHFRGSQGASYGGV